MSPSPQQWLDAARRLWQTGQYELALRAFEHAAAGGAEPATVALLRASLALGRLDDARELVHAAVSRLPASATLAAYAALLDYAFGDRAGAGQRLDALPADHAFAAAVIASLQRALDRPVTAAPASEPWATVLQGQQFVASQGPVTWLAFPCQLIEQALARAPAGGLCVECGVYFGRSIRQLAAGRGQVWGFDSFEGLPEAWSEREPAGTYSTGGQLPEVPDHVTLVAGWFDETLPRFAADHPGPVDLLHVDCDLYSSTVSVLRHLGPRLRPGSLVLFDDFVGYPGWEAHEYRAWQEFSQSAGLRYRYVAGSLLGREVLLEVVA